MGEPESTPMATPERTTDATSFGYLAGRRNTAPDRTANGASPTSNRYSTRNNRRSWPQVPTTEYSARTGL